MSGIELYSAGLHLFDPTTLFFLVFGLLVGITIGALPGLNVTMAVSIMLPLTYGMDPSAGILMLLGRGRRWAAIPLLTGVVMNGILLWLTANPIATIPAAAAVYFHTILLLAGPFYLKTRRN